MIFLLLLTARMALRGSGPAWLVAMVLLGLAFDVKMLAALVCGPALLACWLLATQLTWPRRLAWLAGGGVALVAVGLSWAALFDLTSPENRPYAGSSKSNSMLELIVVHNGLERFVLKPPANPPTQQPVTPGYELYDAVPVGPLRLADANLAAQFAWFLPLAVMGAILAWRRHRAPVALWSLWALSYALIYSAAGGIFHIYYLATLAPPLCALAGIGVVELWRREPRWLAAALAVTALWQAVILYGHLDGFSLWLAPPALGLVAAAAAYRWRWVVVGGGIALAALPLVWTLSTIFAPGNLMLPSTSLARWLGLPDGRGPALSRNFRPASDDARLDEYLLANRGDARFALAAFNAPLVAPFVVHTGAPALAIGGFSGEDPILSLPAFQAMVARGEIRYMLLPIVGQGNAAGYGGPRNQSIARWVRNNGKPVDGALWRSPSSPPATGRRLVLYDLRR